jgi:acetoacetate decarboxylase
MSKYVRLKTLLDKLAPVKTRARDHTDMPAWTQSTRTMPWSLWFGKSGAYTHAIYIRPCPTECSLALTRVCSQTPVA